MFAASLSPLTIAPKELDQYLEKGWFRAGKTIFTTQFLHFNGVLYSAIWLRMGLKNFSFSKSLNTKVKRASRFQYFVKPYAWSQEKENLFQEYKLGIKFNTAQSLSKLLNDDDDQSPFNTYEVCMYDNGRLIGMGIFDIGEKTAEGIVSFSHPDYKKYSLGKVLIAHKITWLKQRNYEYFYHGYFAPNYPAFDYKLSFGERFSEFYEINSQSWLSYDTFESKNDHIKYSYKKLNSLFEKLKELNSSLQLLIYDYYDIELTPTFAELDLLQHPIFITSPNNKWLFSEIFVYNVLKNKYQFIRANAIYLIPQDEVKPGHFTHQILKPSQVIYETEEVEDMMAFVKNAISV